MLGYRLGSAFILLGIIVLTVYLLSRTVDQSDFTLLLAGAGLSLFGLILRRRRASRSEARPSRFRILRQLSGRGEEEQE